MKVFQCYAYSTTEKKRQIQLDKTLSIEDRFAKNVLSDNVFQKAKVGELGQILWENAAQMKDLKGINIDCEYDISLEFVHQNSFGIK